MFVLTFDRGLLPFNAKTPLFAPLFQLPPRYARRSIYSAHPPRVLFRGLDPLTEEPADLVDLLRPFLVHTR